MRLQTLLWAAVKDLYATLGVDRAADAKEIKRAFRKLTVDNHPDKHPGDHAAEERFKAASQAYDVLGDAEKRTLYDEFGEMSLTTGFDPERARAYKRSTAGFTGGRRHADAYGHGSDFDGFSDLGDARATSFDDLLSQLFGGGRVRSDVGDIFGRPSGATPGPRRGQDITGEITVALLDSLLGVTVPLRVEAHDGKARTLDVRVPKGTSDGAILRLRGQGGPGSPTGDILLTVRVAAGRYLSREGDNLRMKLPVTALEAYRGGGIDVTTPWGTVTMSVPAGSQNGTTLRLRGKGVHHPKNPPGDLLVTLDVRMPEPGDTELLQALERLQGTSRVRDELQFA